MQEKNLTTRIANALHRSGLAAADTVSMSDYDLRNLPGIGPKGLDWLRAQTGSVKPVPGFDGTQRDDGLVVSREAADPSRPRRSWQIWPLGRGRPVTQCPYCAGDLATEHSAKITANRMFPRKPDA